MQILAPAGNIDSLQAAVRSGADAVYLGVGSFNARRNADNFGDGGLTEAVKYCHGRGVEVHVTLNTLIRDEERKAFADTVCEVVTAGPDALIVQDWGAVDIIRSICPQIPLSASTQMAIHNIAGAKKLEELGFFQAVLARELSLREIAAIHRESSIRLESFVHGAHCMSVSGMCYMSAALGERSGNRGLCAQPCRLNFRCRGREYALSLKDLSFVEHISELEQAGVTTLKIEGRMKRPEYVAAAVHAVRQAIAGEKPDMEGLRDVFSRSGFTDGYLIGKRDVSMFGVRTLEDAQKSKEVLGKMAELYRRECPKNPVDMELKAQGDSLVLQLREGKELVRIEDRAEPSASSPLTEQIALRALGKTGGTPFTVGEVKLELEEGLLIPGSRVGELRRKGLELLLHKKSQARPYALKPLQNPSKLPQNPSKPLQNPTQKRVVLRFECIEQAFFPDYAEVRLPLKELEKAPELLKKGTVVAELPALIWPLEEEAVRRRLSKLKEVGLRQVSCGNLGIAALAKSLGLSIVGDLSLNISNSGALSFYEEMGFVSLVISPELAVHKAAALTGGRPKGVLVYGRMPLMYFRCCPAKGKNGCGSCEGRAELTDRMKMSFPLLCRDRQFSTLHNSVPLYIGDKERPSFDFELLYFTVETRQEAENIAGLYRKGQSLPFPRTTGMAYRNLK